MALDYIPPPATIELIIDKPDVTHSGINDPRYSLVVVLDDKPSPLLVALAKIPICLNHQFDLPGGDRFMIVGSHIVYERLLSNGSYRTEKWQISFGIFSMSIPSLSKQGGGRQIGPGLLSWRELEMIFSHLIQGSVYNRHRHFNEKAMINLKIYK